MRVIRQLGTQRLILILLLWLAMGLRFHQLEAQSFWNDEGNSARLSERSIPLIIEGTASDIHPPLYYLVLRGWRELAGSHEFGLRAFSAFVGVLTVAVTFALGRHLMARWLAVVAMGLTAVHPALIYYSQETRMYALLAFWAVAATLLLVRWLRQPAWNGTGGAYLLLLVAGLYTHYFFPAVLVGHGVIVGIAAVRARSHWFRVGARWSGLLLGALALYAPWIPIFMRQAGGRPSVAATIESFWREGGRWLVLGETAEMSGVVWLVVGLCVLGVIYGRSQALVPVVGTVVPLAFMLAVGTIQPQFFKFMLVAVPFLCLLMALAWRRWWPVAAVLVLVILGVGNGRSLHNLYTNPAYARADYRHIAARIEAEAHANAGIILDAPNQWEVFTYYHQEGAPVYPIPRGRPVAADIAAELSQIARRHDRLYAIFWGEAQRDPERLVERWLDEHAFKAADEWVGDVRFVMYAVPQAAATEMETAVDVRFGQAITLQGYTVAAAGLAAGDVVAVTLFWQTAVPLTQRYKVFLHLVDAQGRLVAQRDSEPGGGLKLTTIWQPGEVVVDNHGVLIPVSTPPGEYTLLVGLYDVTDAAVRLPIETSDGIQDAFPLAAIVIP